VRWLEKMAERIIFACPHSTVRIVTFFIKKKSKEDNKEIIS
jgi:hypothetical protein